MRRRRRRRRGRRSRTISSTSRGCPARPASPRASSTKCAARTCWSSRAGSASRRTTSGPGQAEAARRVHPGRLGRERLLAERGHGARHEAQADHRRARSSPHRRRPHGAVPAERQHVEPEAAGAGSTSSRTRTRRNEADRQLRRACRPATRRAASRTASTSGPAAPRGAATSLARSDPGPDRAGPVHVHRDVGNGRPIWVTDLTNPRKPEVSDQPIDIWRNDGYTDYSHDVDEDDEGIAWVSGRGGIRGYATDGTTAIRTRTATARPRRSSRCWWPAAASRGTAQPAMLHAQLRPSDRRLGPRLGRQAGQRARRHRGGLHDAVRGHGKIVLSDLTDSWGGEPASKSSLTAPYRMKALDSFHPFIDTPETADPSARVLGPLLRDRGLDARRRLVRPGPAPAGHRQRARRPPDRLLPRHRHGRRDEPDLELVGHGVQGAAPQGDLVYLFDMSRGVEILRMKKGAHHSADEVRDRAEREGGPVRRSAGLVAQRRRRHGFVCPLFL